VCDPFSSAISFQLGAILDFKAGREHLERPVRWRLFRLRRTARPTSTPPAGKSHPPTSVSPPSMVCVTNVSRRLMNWRRSLRPAHEFVF